MMSPCPVFLVIFPEPRKTHATSQCSKNQKKVVQFQNWVHFVCLQKTKLN